MRILRVLPLGLLTILSIAVNGCTGVPALETSQLTPLQIRAIETRNYENHDAKAILKTVLNVLQDEGFLVDYGNAELGLLHASRTFGGDTSEDAYSSSIKLFSLRNKRSPGMLTIEATANVSDFGNQIRVRLNFQRRDASVFFTGPNANSAIGDPYTVTTATTVTDPRIYQEFFAKLDRGLFIQKQGL